MFHLQRFTEMRAELLRFPPNLVVFIHHFIINLWISEQNSPIPISISQSQLSIWSQSNLSLILYLFWATIFLNGHVTGWEKRLYPTSIFLEGNNSAIFFVVVMWPSFDSFGRKIQGFHWLRGVTWHVFLPKRVFGEKILLSDWLTAVRWHFPAKIVIWGQGCR